MKKTDEKDLTLPDQVKEVDWDFELTDEEKELEKSTFQYMPNSGPEREIHKKKLMNATFESISSVEQSKTVQIPVSIFEKFKQTMHKANIPFSVV